MSSEVKVDYYFDLIGIGATVRSKNIVWQNTTRKSEFALASIQLVNRKIKVTEEHKKRFLIIFSFYSFLS